MIDSFVYIWNCLYAEALVKEKRLFDAVISLEVCLFWFRLYPFSPSNKYEGAYSFSD